MKIVIASDHGGFFLKKHLIQYLQKLGFSVNDKGTYDEGSVDYPDYAHPLAEAVERGDFNFGITICGSGNGINMATNKHQKIRSAVCWCEEISKLARSHNDANICSLPGTRLNSSAILTRAAVRPGCGETCYPQQSRRLTTVWSSSATVQTQMSPLTCLKRLSAGRLSTPRSVC